MRQYVLDNVEYWLSVMRFDGLRLMRLRHLRRLTITWLREIVESVRRRHLKNAVRPRDDGNDPATIESIASTQCGQMTFTTACT